MEKSQLDSARQALHDMKAGDCNGLEMVRDRALQHGACAYSFR